MKKTVFGVLLSAGLLLGGTCAYAQGTADSQVTQSASSDRYSWRLDSVVYSFPLRDAAGAEDPEYGRLGRREVVSYTYGLDGQAEASGFSTLEYEEFYTTRKPLSYKINRSLGKHEYRSFGPHGQRTVLHYVYTDANAIDTTGAGIVDSLFRLYQKDEYAFDSVRVIYAEDGGIIRTIHHYDKTTSRYKYTTGACTEIQRVQVLATDSTEDEKQWSCNVTTGVWSMSKDLHRAYTNHKLTYSESTRREYYADGTLYKIWVDGTGYNELGVKTRTYSSYKIYQEDGTPMPNQPGGHAWRENIELFEGGRIIHSSDTRYSWHTDGMHTWHGNPTKDYEYLPNGMVIRTENGNEKYLVDLQGNDHLIYSQNPYFKEPYYSRYIYYDDFTLKQQVDSTIEPVFTQQGDSLVKTVRRVWTITDFDGQGRKTHMIQMLHDTTVTDWTYIQEETYGENYTETVVTQNKTRTTTRTYNYGFDNLYELREEQDPGGNWSEKESFCRWMNVSFGANGAPLTAMQYTRTDQQWIPRDLYTFTYIPEWNLYRRDLRAELNQSTSGDMYTFQPYSHYIDLFTKAGVNEGWYLPSDKKGYVNLYTYDETGRKTRKNVCTLDSSMHVKDTTKYITYRYFPVSSCTKVAEQTTYTRNTETGAWELSGSPTRTSSYTHNVYDDHGNLATTYKFRWDGDLIITDTTDYELVYDSRGRLYEKNLMNGNAGSVNINRKRFLYLENEDPTAYRTLLWYEYSDPKYSGWQEGYDSENRTQKKYDETGRISESISFGISKDRTHAVPAEKYVYYYEDGNPDWISRDHYVMRDGEWECTETSNRRLLLSGAETDEDGDIALRWKRVNTCNGVEDETLLAYSYAADTTTYPVLSPNSYHIAHSADLNTGEYIEDKPASKRVKNVVYSYAKYPNNSFVATYYYTPLRADADEPRLPVTVEPEKESAVFTWGAVEGAVSYVLHVYADAAQTEEICYVVFDSAGKVISIHFVRHAPARIPAVAQMSYTLTELAPGTHYWYMVEGVDTEGKTIETTFGSFSTTGEADTPTGTGDFIGENEDSARVRKIIRDGQMYLKYDGQMYDVHGRKVK